MSEHDIHIFCFFTMIIYLQMDVVLELNVWYNLIMVRFILQKETGNNINRLILYKSFQTSALLTLVSTIASLSSVFDLWSNLISGASYLNNQCYCVSASIWFSKGKERNEEQMNWLRTVWFKSFGFWFVKGCNFWSVISHWSIFFV